MPEALNAELHRLESLLLATEVRRSRPRLIELIDPEFLEFGASGRIFKRDAIIELLTHEAQELPGLASSRTIEAFRTALLAPGVALATYTLIRAEAGGITGRTRRASVWIAGPLGWRLRFHQGTPVPDNIP